MELHCSVSASLDGQDSREMDISEGGELVISHSLIEQGPPSVNSGMVGFATESTDPALRHPVQRVVIHDSDLINDKDRGTFLAYNAFNDMNLELRNVRFIGPGAMLDNTNMGADGVTQVGVESLADRAAAGLPPYSTDVAQLPPPPGCPDFEYF